MIGVRRSKIYLAFLPFLFSGCIKEYLEECPAVTENVRIDFVYTGDGTDDIFSTVVNGVEVYVYDSNGKKVADKRVDKPSLERQQGVSLTLGAGEYRVVCWGNAAENSEISGAESYSTAVLHHPLYVSGGKIPTSDPLYYGICGNLVVPPGGVEVTETVKMRSAHIEMEISVSGDKIGTQFIPVVEVTDLYPEYDFAMNPTVISRSSGYNVASYYPACEYNTEKNAAVARFFTPRFASDDPVKIILRESDGAEPIHTVELKEFLSSNDIRVEDREECFIPVKITFNRDLSVDVTIPEWDVPNVKPEL